MPEIISYATGEREHNNDPHHSHGSWLYLRYKDAPPPNNDTGDRPAGGLTPGTVFYLSPDIRVSPTDSLGNVQTGVDTTVTARIFNGGGIDAFSVYVEFWWFNPTLAFTAATPNQRIGTKIVNVPGGDSYLDVVCPIKWKPLFVNGGHECLVVQCSSPSEGADDLKFPFSATLDRHVAQRNLSVTTGQSGNPLQLVLGTPFQTRQHFTVKLSTLMVGGNMEALRARDVGEVMALLGSLTTARLRSVDDRRLELTVADVTERDTGVRLRRARPTKYLGHCQDGMDAAAYMNNRALADPDFTATALGRTVHECWLQPATAQVLDFEFSPADVGRDHFLVHHFTQVVGGYDFGGYTVIVAPDAFARR